MKVARVVSTPTLDYLAKAIEEWRKKSPNKKNNPVPDELRDKIRSLKGLYRQRFIASAIGIHAVTVSKIMKEDTEKPARQKRTSHQTMPKVIRLAPLQINAPISAGTQTVEMESPQGWKLKVSGPVDLKTIIKAMMEVQP